MSEDPNGGAMSMAEQAQAAALAYSTDAEPGIRRRRAGRGFSYRGPNGRFVTDAATRARIASLAIPPAWEDVWIAPQANGHVQATGRDARGRKQYRYHPLWHACRDDVKYGSLIAFASTLPALRARVDADLRLRGLPAEKVLASIVWLLDNAMIRIGNRSYAQENGSFGLTTLRARHVRVEGPKLRFAFVGKSGKEWKLTVTDRRIARIVRSAQDLPGQHLFQYIDADGARRGVASHDVNAYIRATAGGDVSSKHFRTWGGTVRAAELLADIETPPAKREAARVLNAAIDAVADRLGNTRAVCRRCYIHPRVLADWEAGRLRDDMQAVRRRFRRAPAGLDRQEAVVLRWLECREEETRDRA
jgi:DNA topoisomerase-1